jgi:release factor glutamine methyltransferase
VRLVVFPGVLRPPSDTRLLASTVRGLGAARGAAVLDVFTGSGVLAVVAAKEGAREVTAVDLAHRAVWNARLNARLNRVAVRVHRGNLFAPVAGRRFDLILANPPYVPSATAELPRGGPERAWDAGLDGRALLDRFCAEAAGHLASGGRVLLVQSSLSGEEPTLSGLAASGLDARVVARERGPLGPIATERREMLVARGLLDPTASEEELLVIEGLERGRGGGRRPGRARGESARSEPEPSLVSPSGRPES